MSTTVAAAGICRVAYYVYAVVFLKLNVACFFGVTEIDFFEGKLAWKI